jgi:hypothetical protein
MLLKLLIASSITAFGMIGGQKSKWVRRYLIPSIASIYTALKKKKKKWKATFFLPLIAILSMGYGESSKLRKLLGGSDFWTRIVYGLLIGLFFIPFGKWYALIVMPIAYSVRAGGFKIGKYDWLWEDFIRYSCLGVLVVL